MPSMKEELLGRELFDALEELRKRDAEHEAQRATWDGVLEVVQCMCCKLRIAPDGSVTSRSDPRELGNYGLEVSGDLCRKCSDKTLEERFAAYYAYTPPDLLKFFVDRERRFAAVAANATPVKVRTIHETPLCEIDFDKKPFASTWRLAIEPTKPDANDLGRLLAKAYPDMTNREAMATELASHHPGFDAAKEPWSSFRTRWLQGSYDYYELYDAYAVVLRRVGP